MASLADRKKALDWSNRNAQGFQGILDVNQFLPVTGDVQSGILAAQDLQKGNYGSAALNAVGLLPFVPSLGGTVKNISKVDDIESLKNIFKTAKIESRKLRTPESIEKANIAQKALQDAEMNLFNQKMAQSVSESASPSLGILDYNPAAVELNTLNPTGAGSRSGLYVDYTPNIRATQPLGKNMVSIDKTMGGSPDDIITIYRGAPKKQKKIVPGDFITDMPELAKSYAGDGKVLSMQVRRGDILDDIESPLGNEYLYRPNADKYKP